MSPVSTNPRIDLHPSSNPPSALQSREYDLIVIGGGPAGEMTAMRTTHGGLTVLLIESELVGGECPYWACVPSKALLRPAEVLDAAAAVGGAREVVSGTMPDLEGVWKRRNFFAKNWKDDANLTLMKDHGVDVVRGFGRVLGVKTVSVQEYGAIERECRSVFHASCAVAVCTGSEPTIPDDIPGLVEAKPWTPREAVSASSVPDHLIIVGAGPVGCELATAYAGFGGKVSLISAGQEVMSKFEPEAGKRVREGLKRKGVHIRTGTKITRVQRSGQKEVEVELSDGEMMVGSEILVAAGRRPKTTDIGLDTIGLEDGSILEVDDTLCVQAVPGEWLYAVGDTNGQACLTHMGKYEGKIAGDTIVTRSKRPLTNESDTAHFGQYSATAHRPAFVPQVTFTDPQVATVGLTLAQARKTYEKAKEIAVKMTGSGTFLHAEGYDGWAQWVIDEESGRLLGATFVGRDVADLLHASTVAIVGEMTVERLYHAVPSFPTMSEVYVSLLDACGL